VKAFPTELDGVLLLEPEVHGDPRGFFLESYNAREFARVSGGDAVFVQDNHSRSAHGVLRGLHFQLGRPQGKLVRVTEGEIFDVAVDLRRSSPQFGRWAGVRLNAADHRQLWIPPGFAHGFLVLSASADLLYKTTDYYSPADERALRWDDPGLAIDWPLGSTPPLLSARDAAALALTEIEVYP